MSIRNLKKTSEYIQLENFTLDKNAELPEDIIIPHFKYRSKYLFEFICDERILELIKINDENYKKHLFYVIPWEGGEDKESYELSFDDNINLDYLNFLYKPSLVKDLIPPKHPFAIAHGNIFIINSEKNIVIISDKYYDVTYFYSNNPINNFEEYLIEYVELK